MGLALAAVLMVPLLGPQATDIESEFAALASSDDGTWRTAFESLEERGEVVALLALDQIEAPGSGLGPRERISRARLIGRAGRGAALERVLERLAASGQAPAPEFRRAWIELLGRRDIPGRGGQRAAWLEETALSDPVGDLRLEAVRALGRVDAPEAVEALESLLAEGTGPVAEEAARTLANLPAGTEVLRRSVRGAFASLAAPVDAATRAPQRLPLRSGTLALLLEAYGPAVVRISSSLAEAGERLPLVHGRTHPDPRVRRAADVALDALLDRLVERGATADADAWLAALGRDGLGLKETLYRRAILAVARGEEGLAVRLGRELERLSAKENGEEARALMGDGVLWRVRAALFVVAGHLAAGDAAAAAPAMERARSAADELARLRAPTRAAEFLAAAGAPPRRRLAGVAGTAAVEALALGAVVELWECARLLAPLDGAAKDIPIVSALGAAREAHRLALDAQRLALATDASVLLAGLDPMLDHPLAPGRLLGTPDSRHLQDWINLEARLGRLFATVAPMEVLGFRPYLPDVEGWPQGETWDPLLDPDRRGLLLRILRERLLSLDRQIEEAYGALSDGRGDGGRLRGLLFARRELAEGMNGISAAVPGEGDDGRGSLFLLTSRSPSQLALRHAARLRADGRAQEAQGFSEALIDGLDGLESSEEGSAQPMLLSWLRAEGELALGSALMDADAAQEAEAAILRGHALLEALENTLVGEDRRAALAKGGASGRALADEDPWIERVRIRRGDALMSLAVNANVRLDDQAKALGYFERAFALRDDVFMRVLLACYRARSGKPDESRAILRGIQPTPPLYYNLACTHALLGNTRSALEYLQLELSTNHPNPGSRRRQVEWIRTDPDLAGLRGVPAFQELLDSDS